MAHNLGLLFDAILRQFPTRFQAIVIAAERVAFQRQEYALLMLPDMNQFMDEQTLQRQIAVAKIFAKQVVFRMEPQMAVRGHGNSFRLKPPPFAVVNAYFFKVERIAKDRLDQPTLSNGERSP